MITEDYVSFETAKLLKEKGFNERICHWYDDEEFLHKNTGLYLCNSAELDGRITAPTLQMAMKWLREMHEINIEIITYWTEAIEIIKETPYRLVNDIDGLGFTKDKSMVYGNRIVHNDAVLKEIVIAYNSYEQACEAAIKYCLENLI